MGHDTGVFSTAELHSFGANTAEIRRATKSGQIIDCGKGWWQIEGANPLVVAIVLAGGVLSCLSAIQFYKQTLYPQLYLPSEPTIPHGRLSKHGRSVVSTSDFRWCHGHGRPRPLESAVDSLGAALACAVNCLTEEEWIAVCDSILHYTPLTKDDLREQLGKVSKTIDRMLAKCDGRAMSGPESIARVRLRALGFNVQVQPSIGGAQRADLRIGSLLIEIDSKAHHLSDSQKAIDCRRDRMTLKKGMMTMRVMVGELSTNWDGVVRDIRWITDQDRHRKPYRPDLIV